MADLKQQLDASRRDMEIAVADAEAELARLRQQGARLEELIAVGKAMISAAQLRADVRPAPANPAPAVVEGDGNGRLTGRLQEITSRNGR